MLSLTEIVRAKTKQMVRQEFAQMVMSIDPKATHTNYYKQNDEIHLYDFEGMFNTVLTKFGAPPELLHLDQFDYIIWEESDNNNNDDLSFIRQIMKCYRRNRNMYMGFLSFIVNRNHDLARGIFKIDNFPVSRCLLDKRFSLEDFNTVLAYDVEIGSNIFMDEKHPVMHEVCSMALIDYETTEKMYSIVEAYGPEIMLWTSNKYPKTDRSNVNKYLEFGHIMNTLESNQVEDTLRFLINICPAALKKSITTSNGREDAFTIVLGLCHSLENKRHSWIVHNVFQYVDFKDLNTVYNMNGETLKDLVALSGNSLVIGYLENKFNIRITNTYGRALR